MVANWQTQLRRETEHERSQSRSRLERREPVHIFEVIADLLPALESDRTKQG